MVQDFFIFIILKQSPLEKNVLLKNLVKTVLF